MKNEKTLVDSQSIDKIKSYFSGDIIGSYLFVQQVLLQISDINDIDIVVDESLLIGAKMYLIDNGWKAREVMKCVEVHQPYSHWINKMMPTHVWDKDEYLPIHLMKRKEDGEKFKLFTIDELIISKLNRGLEKDKVQVIKVLSEQIKKNNNETGYKSGMAADFATENPVAYEFHNYTTGHCYVDYIEHDGKGEAEGYKKIPLFAL